MELQYYCEGVGCAHGHRKVGVIQVENLYVTYYLFTLKSNF